MSDLSDSKKRRRVISMITIKRERRLVVERCIDGIGVIEELGEFGRGLVGGRDAATYRVSVFEADH